MSNTTKTNRIYMLVGNNKSTVLGVYNTEEAALKEWKESSELHVWEFFRETARLVGKFNTFEEYKSFEQDSKQCLCGTIRDKELDGHVVTLWNFQYRNDEPTILCPKCLSFAEYYNCKRIEFNFNKFWIGWSDEYSERIATTTAYLDDSCTEAQIIFTKDSTIINVLRHKDGRHVMAELSYGNNRELPILSRCIWNTYHYVINIENLENERNPVKNLASSQASNNTSKTDEPF